MKHSISRRGFLRLSASALAVAGLPARLAAWDDEPEFRLSLSQRSLDRRLEAGTLKHLDFARVAREEFGLDAIDYCSRFFNEKVGDESHLSEMNKRAADHGVRQVLILVADEGRFADADAEKRNEAVRNHRRWIDAAKALGCRAVCVQAAGDGPADEQLSRAAESLAALTEYADRHRINVLVANEGAPASNPQWLVRLLRKVNSPRCAAFPCFNGFGEQDRYKGMARLMEFAKGVCATALEFDDDGHETGTDFFRMMKTVLDAGYRGYVSVEFRGEELDEYEGIRATIALLEKVRAARS
jgi:L-ribulose-5-phosphate 3-epimerase